jgi:hypothetical protein
LARLIGVREDRGVDVDHHLVALGRGPGIEAVVEGGLRKEGQRVGLPIRLTRRARAMLAGTAILEVDFDNAGRSAISEERVEIREKIPAAVEAAFLDEDEGVTGQRQAGRVRVGEQSRDVDAILRPRAIVAREDLEREQVPHLGHRRPKLGENLEHLGGSDDLSFDAGGGKQQIHHDAAAGFSLRRQADRGQPAGGLLLDG